MKTQPNRLSRQEAAQVLLWLNEHKDSLEGLSSPEIARRANQAGLVQHHITTPSVLTMIKAVGIKTIRKLPRPLKDDHAVTELFERVRKLESKLDFLYTQFPGCLSLYDHKMNLENQTH